MYHHHHKLWRGAMSTLRRRRGYQLPIASIINRRRFSSSSLDMTRTRTPCLVLSPTRLCGSILPVFNPSDRRFYNFSIPQEVQGPCNTVRGSGYGWLLMVISKETGEDDLNFYLYNPITTSHIPLPSLPSNMNGEAQIWCDPAKASPHQPLVSIKYGVGDNLLLVYCQGAEDWYFIDAPSREYEFGTTVYHEPDDKLYVVYRDGRLAVLDPDDDDLILEPIIVTPSPEIKALKLTPRLVVGADGDLLLVVENILKLTQYHVFKLDKRCPKWVKTANISNHTLFVYDRYRTVSMAYDPGFTDARPNQIYFITQYRARYFEDVNIKIRADVRAWDLIADPDSCDNAYQEEQLLFGTTHILPGRLGYEKFGVWMVPSLE